MDLQERFNAGYEFSDYFKTAGRRKDQFKENYDMVAFTREDQEFFESIQEVLNILVLCETWCGDTRRNLPVIARIAELNPRFTLRILARDKNMDIMDLYTTEGKRKIPACIFFDKEFREIRRWIERSEEGRREAAVIF